MTKNVTMILMKIQLLAICALFAACNSDAKCKKPYTIAIIDTGFGFEDRGHEAKLCKFGHRDFSIDRQYTKAYDTKTLVPQDVEGHGTNIAGIIDKNLKLANIDYCLVIIKFFSKSQNGRLNADALSSSINYAANIKASYINVSGGGVEDNLQERLAVMRYLDEGGTFISAAGNESSDIDKFENYYYPAQDDPRVIVVGNKGKDGKPTEKSNFGKRVNRWEEGTLVEGFGLRMTGTSQATAIATAKIVEENAKKCDIGN